MINQAKWIAPAGVEDMKPCHFLALKEFEIKAIPASLIMQLTCDGNYLLEINGQIIGRGPARGTRSVAFYDEYDIAGYLHCGLNQAAVLVNCMNIDAQATWPITPALRAAIGETVLSDESWTTFVCADEFPVGGPMYTGQSGFAQYRNMNFDYHLALPEKARTVIVPETSPLVKKELRKRDIPMTLETPVLPADITGAAEVPPCDLDCMEFARINTSETRMPLPENSEAVLSNLTLPGREPVTLPDVKNISMVIDFAKEVSGRVEIVLDAPAGSVADIVYEEELYQGDRLRADHTHTNPTYQFCDRCVLREGKQNIGNLIMERGFRMVQLTLRNLSRPAKIYSITAFYVRYPFAPRAQFFSSDYQLNRLWETAKETISACTTDIFTDCPWRERLFYCNDMVIENRVALKLFGDPAIHKRALRMVFSQKRKDGLFTSTSPSMIDEIPEGKTNFHVILSGNLTLSISVLDYYLHTGDKEMVKECFGQLKKMLETFKSWKDERGIITPPLKYWNFVDWSFELNGMELNGKPTSLLNFLYIISARAFLQLARAIGETPVESEEELERICRNSVETFYSAKDGFFLNSTKDITAADAYLSALGVPPEKGFKIDRSSRLAHALALLAGADPALCGKIADESLLPPELYYGIFLLDGYEKSGDVQSALHYIRTHWGKMLDSGTPTLWENGVHKIGKAGFGGSASLCHGFSSSPAAFLQTVILGVSPLAPGFARFKFAPQSADLSFAKGVIPTPCGSIRVEWKKSGNQLEVSLHVPQNCIAETPQGILSAGDHKLII